MRRIASFSLLPSFLILSFLLWGCSESAHSAPGEDSLDKADSASCTVPTPFEPPASPTGWENISNVLVANQGTANHRGQDVVVREGEPQLLVAKFAYGLIDKDLKGEEVEVFIQEDPPCGPWVSLGTAITSREGEYGSQYGIEDDGGRVFFQIPADHARPVGRYPVRMLVKGDHSIAAFSLFVLQPDTSTIVFDIDGTLTIDDFQIVAQLFSELFRGTYTPVIYADAASVAQAWSQKGYFIIYLTGRPDYLRTISQEWLKEKGLPPGALHLTDTNLQALPTEYGVGQYKAAFLSKMANEARVSLFAAYGNATTDISAYQHVMIPKEHTFIIGQHGGKEGTVPLESYASHVFSITSMPDALIPVSPGESKW